MTIDLHTDGRDVEIALAIAPFDDRRFDPMLPAHQDRQKHRWHTSGKSHFYLAAVVLRL